MVERLRSAIEKARTDRATAAAVPAGARAESPVAQGARPARAPGDAPLAYENGPWHGLEEVSLNPRQLLRERIVALDRSDPAHLAFDGLRTQLLKTLRDNQWSRVAITSPRKGCGKTTVAANLAFSLARQPETGSMLIDLDLRMPQLASRLGQRTRYDIEPFLTGKMPPEKYLRRVGGNLALGLNTQPVRNSAELVQSRRAAAALGQTWDLYRPDIVLFDMPPMLTCDDVLAFLPNVDGVLLVIGGGETKADEIEECERLMAGSTNFLGVILNKAEDADADSGYYGEA